MNNVDKEYFRILNLILEKGRWKNNRTGVKTLSIFGEQAKFDLSDGFPILTTKKVFFKGVVHELLWLISGSTNIKYLVDNNVHIWDGDCYRKYKNLPIEQIEHCDLFLENPEVLAGAHQTLSGLERVKNKLRYRKLTQEEFIGAIKTNNKFAKKWGELGEGTYGWGWRNFGKEDMTNLSYCDAPEHDWMVSGVDQLSNVITKLKTNPDDRRILVSAWHPYWVEKCALSPCHVLFQFHTEELTRLERINILYEKYPDWSAHEGDDLGLGVKNVPERRLNCQMYQRSVDTFLGASFNISSYSLLTCMIAQVVNMVPGTFIHSMGDLHIYENHLPQVKEQLSREPKELPKLWLNPNIKDLFGFKYEDIKLIGYDPHPAIKAEVAV